MIYLVAVVATAATVAVWVVVRRWTAVRWGPDRKWVILSRPEKHKGIALLLLRGAREVLIPLAGAAIFFAVLQGLADLRFAGVDDETTYRAIEEHIRTIRFVAVAPIKPSPSFALIAVIVTSLLGLVMPSLRFFTPNLRRAGTVISRAYTVLTFLAAFTFFGGTYNRQVDDLVVRLNRDLDEIRTAYRQYRTNTTAAAAQIVADAAVRTGAAAPEQERVRAAVVDINIAYADLKREEARLQELRKRGVVVEDRISRAREAIERTTPVERVRRAESRVAADPAPQPHWSKRNAAQQNETLRRAVNFATAPAMREVLQTAAEGAVEKVVTSILRFALGTGGLADVFGEIVSPDALKVGELASRLGDSLFRRTAVEGTAMEASVREATEEAAKALKEQRRDTRAAPRTRARESAAAVIAESQRAVHNEMARMIRAEKAALERQWQKSFGCKSDDTLAAASDRLRRELAEKLDAISAPAERLTSYQEAVRQVTSEGKAAPNSPQALRNLEVSLVGPQSNIVDATLLARPKRSGAATLMAAIDDPTMTYEELMKLDD